MAGRGNALAVVDVRPHATLGALLLALAGACAMAALALGEDALIGAIAALLAGLTLLVATALLWYLPSFAKRRVVAGALASPWPLAGGALALALFGLADGIDARAPLRLSLAIVGAAGVALGALGLSFVLVASATRGAPWRGGIPFWRAEGAFRTGDRVAAALLLAGALGLGLAGAAGLVAVASAMGVAGIGDVPLMLAVWGWATSLALLVMGALVHLLPRSHGEPASLAPLALGALLAGAGIALAPFAIGGGALAALPRALLAVGLVLLLLAIHGHAPAAKRPGPRMREARWPLAAGVVAGFVAGVGFLSHPAQRAADLLLGIVLATLLATAALLVLALPVVFNQRPAARWLPAAALLPLASALLARLALAYADAAEPLRAGSIVALAAGLAALLAALWPLRRPRRYCPPD